MNARPPEPVARRASSVLRGTTGDTFVTQLAQEMARRWQDGECPRAEEYLARYPEVGRQPETALELIYEEWCQRCGRGPAPEAAEFFGRFPQWRPQLE